MATKIGITASLGSLTTPRDHWELIIGRDKTDDPPLPPTLFTAARSSACQALEDVFADKTQKLLLFAESEHDVEDFCRRIPRFTEDGRGRGLC